MDWTRREFMVTTGAALTATTLDPPLTTAEPPAPPARRASPATPTGRAPTGAASVDAASRTRGSGRSGSARRPRCVTPTSWGCRMRELGRRALDTARAKGASYADVRVARLLRQSI